MNLRIAIPINGLLRDLSKQIRSIEAMEGNSTDMEVNPYEYLSSKQDLDDFLMEYGSFLYSNPNAGPTRSVGAELTKFLHHCNTNDIICNLWCIDRGVVQMYTLNYIAGLNQGSFTCLNGIDFAVGKDWVYNYDIIFTDDLSLLAEYSADIRLIKTPYGDSYIDGFEGIKISIDNG